jgi:transposase-like protein/IS1 family transposase
MTSQPQTTSKLTCDRCGSACAKSGKRSDGLQRFRCTSCGKTFSEKKEQINVFETKQAVDDSKVFLAIQLLVEGNSIRSTERITGIHRDTIMNLLVKAGKRAEALLAKVVRSVPAKDVQADEIWTYVGKKEGNKGYGDTREVGDAWCFIGIERHTKIVLAYHLGKRTVSSATLFIEKLATATDENVRFQLSTDGLNAYPFPIGNILGDRVDYGQLVKIYAQNTPEEQRRYSPAKIAETKKAGIYGDPDFDLICTSHIERQNGSLRQWCKRLTRLTYAFSKK